MRILSHRGFWLCPEEKNMRIAFERSFKFNFGTETDLRDLNSKIVISHDMPVTSPNILFFEDILDIMAGKNLMLALNIKADGLIDEVLSILTKYEHTNYFTFDMSIPDMVLQSTRHSRFFTGWSDIVKSPILYDKSVGIWLDSFNYDWFSSVEIDSILTDLKEVCIVSAELHTRGYQHQWSIIKESQYINSDCLMLCTDVPLKAKEYFNV